MNNAPKYPKKPESDPLAGQVVDSIIVKEDIGGPYPVYKRVALDLYADGSTKWTRVDVD